MHSIINYIRNHQIAIYQKECQILIKYLGKGKEGIFYPDFLQLILPHEEPYLRDQVSKRQINGNIDDDFIGKTVMKIFLYEVLLIRQAETKKLQFFSDSNWDITRVYETFDRNNNLIIEFDEIHDLFKRNNYMYSQDMHSALMRRIYIHKDRVYPDLLPPFEENMNEYYIGVQYKITKQEFYLNGFILPFQKPPSRLKNFNQLNQSNQLSQRSVSQYQYTQNSQVSQRNQTRNRTISLQGNQIEPQSYRNIAENKSELITVQNQSHPAVSQMQPKLNYKVPSPFIPYQNDIQNLYENKNESEMETPQQNNKSYNFIAMNNENQHTQESMQTPLKQSQHASMSFRRRSFTNNDRNQDNNFEFIKKLDYQRNKQPPISQLQIKGEYFQNQNLSTNKKPNEQQEFQKVNFGQKNSQIYTNHTQISSRKPIDTSSNQEQAIKQQNSYRKESFQRIAGTVFRATKNTQIINKTLTVRSVCSFSNIENIEKAKSKLFKSIEREHKFEVENFQKDESIEEFLSERKFELVDSEDSICMELVSTTNNQTIRIAFTSRQPSDQEPEEEGAENPEEQQQEDNYQDYCDFTVYIQKKGESQALAYECSSFDSEINIHAINIIKDVEAHKQQNKLDRMTSDYVGPDFNTLDERLQTSMIEYLKSVGIDEEVAAFIEHVSLDKEQRLYMKWLKDLKTYLE